MINSKTIDAASGLSICGAKVQRQLNGTTLYIVFAGTEQNIVDAYNTLYNAHCFDGELQWLHAGAAYVVTNAKRFQAGLLTRQEIRLIMGDLSSFKGMRGGIESTAKSNASRDWASMEDVRVILPVEAVLSPAFHKVQGVTVAPDWHCERPDANCE